MALPYDHDLQFGVCLPGRTCNPWGAVLADSSFFVSEEGNRSNRSAGMDMNMLPLFSWNVLRDSVIKVYREELKQRWMTYTAPGGPLETGYVNGLIDAAAAAYNRTDAQAAYSQPYEEYCGDPTSYVGSMKRWVRIRNQLVAGGMFD
jgi:hypothetical protein